MIDDIETTNRHLDMQKEALPFRATITPYLAKTLAEQEPKLPIPAHCHVVDVSYSGDLGGILCRLDVGGTDSRTPVLVSISHLAFNRKALLAGEIARYQHHRIKKLKKQQDHGFQKPY